VWQRVWTDAVRDAVTQSSGTFRAYRVQGLVVDRTPSALPLDGLATVRPVVLVARIEVTPRGSGEAGRDRAGPAVDDLAVREGLVTQVEALRARGLTVRGIEIDHDCPTSRLGAYAAALRQLRAGLPEDLELSATALPTWTTDERALVELRKSVDHTVLQLHAIDDARTDGVGLFEPERAVERARRYAALHDAPFYVALPAYGVGLDQSGRIHAERSPVDGAAVVRELRVDPHQVARALGELAERRPSGLRGVVWFRLPTRDDVRAWSWSTLSHVIAGRPLVARIEVRLVRDDDDRQLFDVVAVNPSETGGAAPASVTVAGPCSIADGVGGYARRRAPGGWTFERSPAAFLAPDEALSIGWVRCGRTPNVEIR